MERRYAAFNHRTLPLCVLARQWVWPEQLYDAPPRGFGDQDRQMRVWLALADGRVLALRFAQLASPDDRAIAPALAALEGDLRGLRQGLEPPGVGYVHVLYGAPLAPPPRIRARSGRVEGNLVWAPGLEAEVLEVLRSLKGLKFYLSVRNYNRLATLPDEVRLRRLQALLRFPPLVAPILLTAHQYPNCFDGRRHAWRYPNPDVEAVIDQGKDLTGALARHYGISKGLVRSAVNAEYWEAGYEARRAVLRFLDALPANKRPADTAALMRELQLLHDYLRLFGEDDDGLPHAPRLPTTHARAFALGWAETWQHLRSRYAPLYRSFADVGDFVAAARHDAVRLTGRRRGPSLRRLVAAWIQAYGLLGLMRDSVHWHAWRPRQKSMLPPPKASVPVLPALVGEYEEGGFHAWEFLTAAALDEEGFEMRHCVGGYWPDCLDGERIFALRAADGRRATAQFVPTHDSLRPRDAVYRLVQLRGPCNAEVFDDLAAFAKRLETHINAPEREEARRAVLRGSVGTEPEDTSPPAPPRPGLDPGSARRLPAVLAVLELTPVGPQALLAAFVAGYDYHDGPRIEAECGALPAPNDALPLVREPDNLHDALAVRIDWQGFQLGYVPRPDNADIARRLDANEPLACRLLRFDPTEPAWRRIEFVIEEATT